MNPRFVPTFGHVTDWVFDLDNCLYPASSRLFELIDERMGAYIERLLGVDPTEAKRVQKSHFHTHGIRDTFLVATSDWDNICSEKAKSALTRQSLRRCGKHRC